MDKREYLRSIINELEEDSNFKIIFEILESENMITDEMIDWMILELENLSTKILDKDYQEKINQMKLFLVNLKTKESEERQREIMDLMNFDKEFEILIW